MKLEDISDNEVEIDREKRNEHARNYYHKNKKKIARYSKKYYKKNKEKYSKYAREYRKTENGNKSLERARQKERDNLSNNYIRQNIYLILYRVGIKIVRKNISIEQIEEYRQGMIAKRQLKQLKNENL